MVLKLPSECITLKHTFSFATMPWTFYEIELPWDRPSLLSMELLLCLLHYTLSTPVHSTQTSVPDACHRALPLVLTYQIPQIQVNCFLPSQVAVFWLAWIASIAHSRSDATTWSHPRMYQSRRGSDRPFRPLSSSSCPSS